MLGNKGLAFFSVASIGYVGALDTITSAANRINTVELLLVLLTCVIGVCLGSIIVQKLLHGNLVSRAEIIYCLIFMFVFTFYTYDIEPPPTEKGGYSDWFFSLPVNTRYFIFSVMLTQRRSLLLFVKKLRELWRRK